MSDQVLYGIYGIGALVLAVSALAAHRIPMASALKMALAWLAIFVVLLMGVTWFTAR